LAVSMLPRALHARRTARSRTTVEGRTRTEAPVRGGLKARFN
jgi:hypothetical protein